MFDDKDIKIKMLESEIKGLKYSIEVLSDYVSKTRPIKKTYHQIR